MVVLTAASMDLNLAEKTVSSTAEYLAEQLVFSTAVL